MLPAVSLPTNPHPFLTLIQCNCMTLSKEYTPNWSRQMKMLELLQIPWRLSTEMEWNLKLNKKRRRKYWTAERKERQEMRIKYFGKDLI